MKAIVTKTLHINSPIQLSQIIVKEGLSDNKLFKDFCSIVSEYLKGCNCISDPNYSLMINEYNSLSVSGDVINLLKEKIRSNILFTKIEHK